MWNDCCLHPCPWVGSGQDHYSLEGESGGLASSQDEAAVTAGCRTDAS